MQFQTALMQTFALLVPILIGCLIRKIKLVDDSFAGNLSKFLFNVSLPCTIINVMQLEYDKSVLVTGGQLMLICVGITAVSYALSFVLVHILHTPRLTGNVFQFATTFSNFSYMAYPIALGLYGEEGLFYTVLYSLPLFILVNSVGIIMLHHEGGRPNIGDCKKALNLPTFAVIVGVLLYLFSWKIPAGLDQVISMLDQTTTPLAMVLAGLVLSRGNLREVFGNWKLYLVSGLRLILLPVLAYLALKWLGISGLMRSIPVLVTCMPVVANIVILTSNGKGDSEASANVLLLSTLLSMVTIPLIATFLR